MDPADIVIVALRYFVTVTPSTDAWFLALRIALGITAAHHAHRVARTRTPYPAKWALLGFAFPLVTLLVLGRAPTRAPH
jgi:hypothetical protein